VIRIYILAIAFILSSFKLTEDKPLTIWLIGDSTMAQKPTNKFPEHGWGMPFANYFNHAVQVKNKAKNGRSTRTFLQENLWQPIVDSLQEGDYVFIQFGHNDESQKHPDRYTSPEDYRINLLKFINETKAKKATPILLTPVSRRYFDKEGKIKQTHLPYSDVVRVLAKEQNVMVIDLDEKSRNLYQQFGDEDSKLLFLDFPAGLHPNYPEGAKDGTHFNEYGARRIAELVLQEIKKQQIGLTTYIVK
jgi:lysophospholipase L1-like esterase